jgi:nucleoside-diphosphate-sugar epimerase
MKVILTGITGNLGYEIALDLLERGFDIVPVVRSEKKLKFLELPYNFKEVIYNDLLSPEKIQFNGNADCIIHCAGIVHFLNSGQANEKMMMKVIDLARFLKTPLYFISTAFVYKPNNEYRNFNNSYEKDKWQSEQILIKAGIPYGIFRPSILVGNSRTGKIQNFSGHYFVVQAFLSAINNSAKMGLKFRFPRLLGKDNLVTIDQVAKGIGQAVTEGRREILFLTNPSPPTFDLVFTKTLEYFKLGNQVEFLNCSFKEFGDLKLTDEEKKFYQLGLHFSPYWSLDYDFPNSLCVENLISEKYIIKILDYFSHAKNLLNEPEQTNY